MQIDDAKIRALFTERQAAHPRVVDAIAGERQNGYPIWMLNIMQHDQLERIAGLDGYKKQPVEVYRAAQLAAGVDFIDQWIPQNPLTIEAHGYESSAQTVNTGGGPPVIDGIEIREPEDVLEHLEGRVFPALRSEILSFDREARVRRIGTDEYAQQIEMGEGILKTGYDYVHFPHMRYDTYGYVNYFCAYAMEPSVMARDFQLQAELSRLNNEAAAEAVQRYNLPRLFRLDHDMTDSRGTLVDLRSLKEIWFPELARALEPMRKSGLTMIWHCDGAVSSMVDSLIEVGVAGFQGFQYEDGVDYRAICEKKTRDGAPLFIIGGVSVTRILPFGTPGDVRRQLKWLVDSRGDATLALGCSSSVAPGVPWENLNTLMEGLRYYKAHSA